MKLLIDTSEHTIPTKNFDSKEIITPLYPQEGFKGRQVLLWTEAGVRIVERTIP